jgi:pterin-4a-carbinolamine dehydratase
MTYTSERDVLADAYQVQDACNLSGIVHSFAEACSFLMRHGCDSLTILHHPAVVLYVEKIVSMFPHDIDCFATQVDWDCARKAALTRQEEREAKS